MLRTDFLKREPAGTAHGGGRRSAWLIAFFLLTAFFLMMICTRSSFLYPYNNWDDSNSYFTMGKSWFHGYVPYRDLFDQKGPWLYFVYGLCSLISSRSFTGVFLMETIICAADLYLIYRAARTALPDSWSLACSAVTGALIFTSRSFYWGGCAEELLLPALLLPLVQLLEHDRNTPDAPATRRMLLTAGICCGFAAATKFILLGFYFAYMLLVFAQIFRQRGDATVRTGLMACLRASLLFLGGMLLPFLPWLVWFGLHGALDDWYRDYIYTNVFLYSSFGANAKGGGLMDKFHTLALILYWLIRQNTRYMVPALFGVFACLFRKGTSLVRRLALPFLFFCLFLGIFIGGSELPYYSFPLTCFAMAGVIAAAVLLRQLAARIFSTRSVSRPAAAAGVCIAAACSILFAFCTTPNLYYMSYGREDMFLDAFTRVIEADGRTDPTLFNYNCLDCGLLTAAGLYPGEGCYWFQTQTLPTDEVLDEQHRYIQEGLTDYVVARASYPAFIFERYELADTFDQVMGEKGELSFTYYLFRRKD